LFVVFGRGGLFRVFLSLFAGFGIIRVTLGMVLAIRLLVIGVMSPVILTALLAIFPATLMLVLLGLVDALLLGPLVQGGGEILESADEMDAEVTFGFVGFFDGLGDVFDRRSEVFE